MKKSLALIAAALLLPLTACGGSSKASNYTPPPAPKIVKVKFEAYKTLPSIHTKEFMERNYGTISTTFSTASGIEQHDFNMALKNGEGARYAHYSFKSGSTVSLSVQDMKGMGSVTCRLSVDGVVISENTSSSDYGIASCSGVAR